MICLRKFVKKRFSKNINNIKIIYKDVITPWIAACELYLHSGCSSFLEAASLKKKIIYFSKSDHEKKAKMYKEFGYYFNNIDKCFNFLKKNEQNNNFLINKSKEPKLIIENSNSSKMFYKDFINFLYKNYDKKLASIQNSYPKKNLVISNFDNFKVLIKKIILNIPFLESIFFQFNASNILSNKYKIKKFPYLKKKEILKYVYRLNNKNNKIQIDKLSEGLFYLRKNR